MKRIFVTVDTECHDIAQENNYIWGEIKGKKWGLPLILEEGKRLGVPINVFFDMCEAKRYGKEYAARIIDETKSYGHPVYLHLHPNYLSGDDKKSYLWQYSLDEQREILREGIEQYKQLTGKDGLDVFRAGRYSSSPDMYTALQDLGESALDLSYCYRNEKMCKLSFDEIGVKNVPTTYKGQTILPNTRFICFDYLGKRRALNTDLREAQLGELKDVIRATKDGDIVFTMHSWHFVDRYFFSKKIRANRAQLKKFRKIVAFCKQNGWTFADLGAEQFDTSKKEDVIVNNSKSLWGKIKSLFYNFKRFQDIAKLNKKYFLLYAVFYGLLGAGAIAALLLLI